MSFIFGGNTGETASTLKRKRDYAEAMLAKTLGRSPKTVGEGLTAVGAALGGRIALNRTNSRIAEGEASAADLFKRALMGQDTPISGVSSPPATIAPSVTSAAPAASVGGMDLKGGIADTAQALGIDPVDLATAISYETAGTFDPTKAGPTTQWGQHRGLIQFGEPQAKKYGVNWDDPVASQLGANGAVANYLRDAGVKPGMGLMDIYSAINAGSVGLDVWNRKPRSQREQAGTVPARSFSQQFADLLRRLRLPCAQPS